MPDERMHEGAELSAADEPPFQRLLERLSTEHNFDFRQYKIASLARRIRSRMSQVRIDDFDRYAEYLSAHTDEAVVLFNMILINVTGFFRDAEAWDVLGREVIPSLVDGGATSGGIRIWCAGCSTGEEAYSVALTLAEALGDRARRFDVKIYATDLDDEALATARHGFYRLEQLKDVPEPLLDRHFAREGQLYRIAHDLRRWCIFGHHNLTVDPPLSHVDLVICRNVLIYLKSSLQERLLPRFHYALRDHGFLFLGKSESLLARSPWFTPVNAKWRIFQRASQVPARPDAPALRLAVEAASPGARATAGYRGVAFDAHRVVEALSAPVFAIDSGDTILTWNQAAAALYEIPAGAALGKEFRDLDISYRAEGLRARLEDVKTSCVPGRLDGVTFTRRSGAPVHVDIVIAPLVDDGRVVAIVVSASEVTERMRLHEEISRLSDRHAMASEELQSTNEELETTNEELQSTNEELETTNEELQSTNEELLTTVDELQAANAELAVRTAEARRLALYQQSIVDSVTEGIVVLDRHFVVTSWNRAAEQLWGVRAPDALGRDFFALPIGDVVVAARHGITGVKSGAQSGTVTDVRFTVGGMAHTLRLLPLLEDGQLQGVLVMIRPESPAKG